MSAPDPDTDAEAAAIVARYARRGAAQESRYDPLLPNVYLGLQERQRAIIALWRAASLGALGDKRCLEVGCGNGANLLELIALGADPSKLLGNDLLPARLAEARARLPASVRLLPGDATALELADRSFELIVQSTVFSSILDPDVQRRLAERLWAWLVPGGALLWYDFTVGNPANPDVAGVPLKRVRALFPDAQIRSRRVTLAPPLARSLCRVSPALYGIANAVPWLRTHRVCLLIKAR